MFSAFSLYDFSVESIRLFARGRNKAVYILLSNSVVGLEEFALDGCKTIFVPKFSHQVDASVAPVPVMLHRPLGIRLYVCILLTLSRVVLKKCDSQLLKICAFIARISCGISVGT